MRQSIVVFLGLMFVALQASAQPTGNLILQVPDWNQPLSYGVGGYPRWCSPTAGANLMGYWEDIKGCVGLTDRQAFNASPAYPTTPGTWQQGLWHDGIVEMGWHMNTGGWQNQGPPPNFPPNAGGTNVAMILCGLLTYAQSGWVDDSYGPNPGTGIVKVAYPNVTGFFQRGGGPMLGLMWQTYCGEINAARPVEVTFDHWVDWTFPPGSMNIPGTGQSAETYVWDLSVDPHSVVGVGYIDITPGFQNNGTDEWFVCQDGWGTTGQYVAVPLDAMWQQNDYITYVPEPSTFLLLSMGTVGLLAYAWRKRWRR